MLRSVGILSLTMSVGLVSAGCWRARDLSEDESNTSGDTDVDVDIDADTDSGTGANIFVTKLDSRGAFQWHTFYGLACGNSLVVDGKGNLYVSGDSHRSWNGPRGQNPLNAYSGKRGIFVLKLLD